MSAATEIEVDRALGMLRPQGFELLDLACGIGRHSIELSQRGGRSRA